MKKTTSENLSKKLSKYSAFSAAIAGVAGLHAQVGYTDPNPDIVVQKDGDFKVEIDFNGDSVNELIFYQSGGGANVLANLTNSVQILGSSSAPDVYPYVLMQSDPISASQINWLSGSFQILNYSSGVQGNWAGQNEKFLGIRFNIGANTHYGWLRLTVPTNADDGITIHDFYYNATPNDPTTAGFIPPLSIEDDYLSSVKIVSLNKKISLYNLPNITDYRLYSISGQFVLEGKTNQKNYAIDGNTLASGLYIVEVSDHDSGAILRKKILL